MADPVDLSFEDALARLEAVVVRLEKGELSLEQSLGAYEDGVRLVHAARARLDGMQTRLEQLLHDGSTAPLAAQSKESNESKESKESKESTKEKA